MFRHHEYFVEWRDVRASSPHSYLRQVLKEALRRQSVGPYAARFQNTDCTLGGHHVPAGVSGSTGGWGVDRRSRLRAVSRC